jgi:hypothetical protein
MIASAKSGASSGRKSSSGAEKVVSSLEKGSISSSAPKDQVASIIGSPNIHFMDNPTDTDIFSPEDNSSSCR